MEPAPSVPPPKHFSRGAQTPRRRLARPPLWPQGGAKSPNTFQHKRKERLFIVFHCFSLENSRAQRVVVKFSPPYAIVFLDAWDAPKRLPTEIPRGGQYHGARLGSAATPPHCRSLAVHRESDLADRSSIERHRQTPHRRNRPLEA